MSRVSPTVLLSSSIFCAMSQVFGILAASAEASRKPLTAKEEFTVGQLYFSTDNFPQAIEHFTRAIKLDPTNGQFYFERGHAYYRLNQYIQATPDYTRALQMKYKPSLIYERRAFIYLDSNQYKKGIEDCTEAIKNDPRSRIAYLNRWKAYMLTNDREKSKQDAAKIKQLDRDPRPKDLCDRCQLTHNSKLRVELCTQALEKDPKYAQALLLLGSAYIDLGRKKEAINCFNSLIALDQNDLTAYVDRGLCRLQFGSFADGIKDLSLVLDQAPECFQAYYWRGESYRLLGQSKPALADYKKAIALIKANMTTDYAHKSQSFRNTLGKFFVSTYRGSAHTYEATGDLSKAIADITIAINESREAPNDLVELLPERAQLLKKAGRDQEMHQDLLAAKAVLEKIEAIKRGPVIPPPPMHGNAGDKNSKGPQNSDKEQLPD